MIPSRFFSSICNAFINKNDVIDTYIKVYTFEFLYIHTHIYVYIYFIYSFIVYSIVYTGCNDAIIFLMFLYM